MEVVISLAIGSRSSAQRAMPSSVVSAPGNMASITSPSSSPRITSSASRRSVNEAALEAYARIV